MQGRLWRQLGLIRRRAPWRYLLVEGRSIYEGPVSREAIRGLVIAVDELGVCVRPLYAQRPKREPGISPPEQALSAAAGISTVTARRLLDQFGSLLDELVAAPEELRRVPGVGANGAHAIQSLAQSN